MRDAVSDESSSQKPRTVTGSGDSVKKRYLVSLVGFLLTTLVATSLVYAVPPAQVRGLDISAVVAMYDRARQTQFRLRMGRGAKEFKKVETIVIDPGHGGENQGAFGVAGIHEKYLTLEWAYELRERLQKEYPGVRVVMTRYWDEYVGLHDRIHYANEVGADLFISLHYNAAVHRRAAGFETYYLTTAEAIPGKEEKKGKPIATAAPGVTGISKNLDKRPEATTASNLMTQMQADMDRQRLHHDCAHFAKAVNGQFAVHLDDANNRGVKQANFAVLRGANMPAIVVEAGFVSHPKEGKKITRDHHRKKLVDALVAAIENFDSKLAQRDETK